MANAIARAEPRSSSGRTNGAKLIRLLIDGGTLALQSVLAAIHHPASLNVFLNKHHMALYRLLTRKIITGRQWDLLFPPRGALPDSNTFDITLLSALLWSICGLHWPESGWDSRPPRSDQSLEAHVARINFMRNEVHASLTSTAAIDDDMFTRCWEELSDTLMQVCVEPAKIDSFLQDPVNEQLYMDLLHEWKMHDGNIKEELKDINQEKFKAKPGALSSKAKASKDETYSRRAAPGSERVRRCTQNSCFANKTWFYGKMSREESESLLEAFGKVGEFIVRQSEHGGVDVYALSVRESLRIGHYQIKMSRNGALSFGVGRNFMSWDQLVAFLETSRVGGSESPSAPFLTQFQKVVESKEDVEEDVEEDTPENRSGCPYSELLWCREDNSNEQERAIGTM